MTPARVAIRTLPRLMPSITPLSVVFEDQKPLPKRAVRSFAAATLKAAISAASAATARRIDNFNERLPHPASTAKLQTPAYFGFVRHKRKRSGCANFLAPVCQTAKLEPGSAPVHDWRRDLA